MSPAEALQAMQQAAQVLTEERASLDQLEASLAAEQERLSQEATTAAAYSQGQYDERRRVLLLIEHQLYHLQRAGVNPISLRTLASAIRGVG